MSVPHVSSDHAKPPSAVARHVETTPFAQRVSAGPVHVAFGRAQKGTWSAPIVHTVLSTHGSRRSTRCASAPGLVHTTAALSSVQRLLSGSSHSSAARSHVDPTNESANANEKREAATEGIRRETKEGMVAPPSRERAAPPMRRKRPSKTKPNHDPRVRCRVILA